MQIVVTFEPHVLDDPTMNRSILIKRDGEHCARFPIVYRDAGQSMTFSFPQYKDKETRHSIEVIIE